GPGGREGGGTLFPLQGTLIEAVRAAAVRAVALRPQRAGRRRRPLLRPGLAVTQNGRPSRLRRARQARRQLGSAGGRIRASARRRLSYRWAAGQPELGSTSRSPRQGPG